MNHIENLNPEMRARLLKKWKTIYTKYCKLRDNWFIKVWTRWNTRVTKDFNKTKQFYLDKINQAECIINNLSQTNQLS